MLDSTDLNTTARLSSTIDRALDWSHRNQKETGFWVGFLQTNSTMEAEFVLAIHFLGVEDPKVPEVLRAIRSMQRPDGAWGVYHEAPHGDINATVECYAALRCVGASPDDPALARARSWILSHGGIPQTRVFTRIWLALVGEWPWSAVPCLPPELIWFPRWFPFCLYNFSSWARGTIVPLTILSDRRPVRPFLPVRRLDELHADGPPERGPDGEVHKVRVLKVRGKAQAGPRKGGWERFFLLTDRLLSLYTKSPWKPGREAAIVACRDWIVSRQEADGCWAGIQPPWIYALMALHVEGYALDHPVIRAGIRAMDPPWAEQTEQGTFLQACTSPVWDTLLTQLAMLDCGVPASETAFERSLAWVLNEQIRVAGDWKVKSPEASPGGWSFEYQNDTYPDVDDTAVAIIVLARARATARQPAALEAALQRAVAWVEAMVSRNGAWAAFDKDNDEPLINKIPFCDFGEALDPPSADVTAHVVEALGVLGRDLRDPVVARAVDYLRREQEPDGSWFGRWGVNYVYGTGAVIPALERVGENMQADYVRRACDWLRAHQNADGGWGESCASYMDDSWRGRGPSTPSQTAWALLALLAQGDSEQRRAIESGLAYLVNTQTPDGSWEEEHYTGTGFPGYGGGARVALDTLQTVQGAELSRGFMLRYHMYRHYFPLMALGRAREHLT